jgi:hypothetical protein
VERLRPRADPGELGRVGLGAAADQDFTLERDAAGRLFITPARSGASLTLYGSAPLADLTDIDAAPSGGYSRSAIEALPGWGYVFRLDQGDQFYRFGALRATHVGRDLLIFDWAFQTDPGNPELIRAR